MNFLPGDTAPKDGTPIIGYWKGRAPEYDCIAGIVYRTDDEGEVFDWYLNEDPTADHTHLDCHVAEPDYWHPWPNREDYT